MTAIAERWELIVGEPSGLSYNWVTVTTRADGSSAVLRRGPARAGHLRTGVEALSAFAGWGSVRVLERDDEQGARPAGAGDPGHPGTRRPAHC